MRVGFLINDLSSGGSERATCGICKYLANNGIDTTIVTVNDCVPFYDVDENVKLVSLSCNNIEKKAGFKRFFSSISKSFYIRKRIREMNFDIVIAMSVVLGNYALFSTVFTRTKCICTERNDPYLTYNSFIHKTLKKITAKHSDGYIFQTAEQENYYPIPLCGKKAVIPNAVFNKYAYTADVPSEREKTVTALGRLVKQKRYDDMVRAFVIFHEKYPEYTLQIFGEGDEKENLQNLIDSFNASDYIIINEPRNDAILFAARSSAYILCSEYEGLPNALLESLYCGVPCISSIYSPAVKELITDGQNGLLFEVGDIESISRCLERIISNKAFSDNLSSNAILSTRKYDIENIGEEWIRYFKDVIMSY